MTEQEMRDAVVAEAMTWLRTPFRHRGRLKGRNGGVDCAGVLLETYERAGCTPHIEPAAYVMQAMLHDNRERFVEVLATYGREISAEEAKRGDAVVWKVGRSYSHGGILIEDWPGRVVHAVQVFGVQIAHGTRDAFLSARRERRFFTLAQKQEE